MLLLFGIPVFVWMKWRQRVAEPRGADDDEAFSLQRATRRRRSRRASGRPRDARTPRVGAGDDAKGD